jgi:hypothetical protein
VLFNRLVGNGTQFAIQITIHQLYGFFAIHLISTYSFEPPNIP